MAHLNCLPPRAAGVIYWFFLLVHLVLGVGIKQKCEMLLRKIDGKMNVQNCGFLQNGDGGDMLRDWWQVITDSCYRFSKRWHVADVKNIVGDDQTTLMVHRNFANIACTFRFYVCLRLHDRDCCSATDGRCHAPALSYFEELTCCRHQKLHWRWPGNPNGWSKLHNLGLFMFTLSQLTLRQWLRGWWRLLKIAQTARSRRQKHHRDDQDRSKFRKYDNLCLRDQAKPFFAAMNNVTIDSIAQFLSCYHSQRLLFSHSKNNFSMTWTHRKTEIYILYSFLYL